MRIEKLEAKFEQANAMNEKAQERVIRLTEEIGELRSMLIEREKGFLKIESEFAKMSEAVSAITPGELNKKLNSIEKRMLKTEAEMEKRSVAIQTLSDEMKDFRSRLAAIKSIENLADVLKQIDAKTKAIDDAKAHSTRMAAKAEEMFLELDKRLPELEKSMDRIAAMDEVVKDLVKISDSLSIKLRTALHKEDLEKLEAEIRERIVGIESRVKSLAPELGEIRRKEKGPEPEIDIPSPGKAEEVTMAEIPPVEGKPKTAKEKMRTFERTIPDMIEEAKGLIKLGGHSSAKKLYDKILEQYKVIEDKNPAKAKEYYKDVNKLYKAMVKDEKKV